MNNIYISIHLYNYIIFHVLVDGKGGGGGGSRPLTTVTMKGKAEVGELVEFTCSYPHITKAVSIAWFRYADVIFIYDKVLWTHPYLVRSKKILHHDSR